MSKEYDIVIVGGGAMGLATAAQLAQTDKKVLVLEQFGFFNQREVLLDCPDSFAFNTPRNTWPNWPWIRSPIGKNFRPAQKKN